MRPVFTLFITAAFAISAAFADASFSEPVQNCFNDITAASGQLAILANAIDAFKIEDGFEKLQHEEGIVESHLKSAGVTCCVNNPDGVTDEEGIAGVALMNNYTSRTSFALIIAATKANDLQNEPSVMSALGAGIENLKAKNDAMIACLAKSSPESYIPALGLLNATISEAYDTTLSIFNAPL